MNRKDHDLLSSTGPPIALGYATTNFFSSQFPPLWSNPCHTVFFLNFFLGFKTKNILEPIEYFHLLLVLKGYYFQALKSKRCLHNKVIYKIYNPKIKEPLILTQIYIFILQSVHLLYKYTTRINFCFIRSLRINF